MTEWRDVLMGAGLMGGFAWILWRMFVHYDAKNEDRINRLDTKNEQAHAAITENIKAVDERAERRADGLEAAVKAVDERAERRADGLEAAIKAADERAERRAAGLEAAVKALQGALDAITRDLAFLAGRQTERDQRSGADGAE